MMDSFPNFITPFHYSEVSARKKTSECYDKDAFYVWFEDGYHLSILAGRHKDHYYFVRHGGLKFERNLGCMMKCVATEKEFKEYLLK